MPEKNRDPHKTTSSEPARPPRRPTARTRVRPFVNLFLFSGKQVNFHSSKTYIIALLTPSALSESAPSPAYLLGFQTDDIFLFFGIFHKSQKHDLHATLKTSIRRDAGSESHIGRSPDKISFLLRKQIKQDPVHISGHYPP